MLFDRSQLDIECEQCRFWNEFTYLEARRETMLICRGCKANIHLRDTMGTVERSARTVRRATAQFDAAFNQAINSVNRL